MPRNSSRVWYPSQTPLAFVLGLILYWIVQPLMGERDRGEREARGESYPVQTNDPKPLSIEKLKEIRWKQKEMFSKRIWSFLLELWFVVDGHNLNYYWRKQTGKQKGEKVRNQSLRTAFPSDEAGC